MNGLPYLLVLEPSCKGKDVAQEVASLELKQLQVSETKQNETNRLADETLSRYNVT